MKYKIKIYQDNICEVYNEEDSEFYDYLFKGTLEEVNAWISLKEKGYDF